MNKRDEEALESAYSTAAYEVTKATDAASIQLARDIATRKSVNLGALFGEAVKVRVTSIEEAVGRLIEAHLQTGEKDATTVTMRIKAFVDSQPCPGLHGHGDPQELRTVAFARSDYEMGRGSIAARVADKVRLALLAKRSETTRLREITKWMENNTLGAWVVAIVTGFAVLRGILGFAVTDLPKIVSLFSRKTL